MIGQSFGGGSQFVGLDELPAVQSYEPCHIFGDSDMYGIGIRVSFYIQYLAAIIAIRYGAYREFKVWRASFLALAFATFVGIAKTSNSGTLVILDWAIMNVLFFLLLLICAALAFFMLSHQSLRYVETTEPDREQVFLQREYIRAFEALRAEIIEESAETAREAQEALENFARAMELNGIVLSLAAGPLAQYWLHYGLAALRQQYEQALQQRYEQAREQHAGINHALALESAAQAEELARAEQTLQWHFEVRAHAKVLRKAGLLDAVTPGMGLILYSVFLCYTVWLYFVGIEHGRREDCSIKVLYFFAPINVYNHGFLTFLRVLSCLALLVAAIAVPVGVRLIVLGMKANLERTTAKKTGSDTVERAPARGGEAPVQGAAVPARQRGDEPDEAALERFYSRELAEFLNRFLLFFSGFLICIIILVELTVWVNKVDLKPAFSSGGELIAFLTALLTLLTICWSAFVEQRAAREAEWVHFRRRLEALGHSAPNTGGGATTAQTGARPEMTETASGSDSGRDLLATTAGHQTQRPQRL